MAPLSLLMKPVWQRLHRVNFFFFFLAVCCSGRVALCAAQTRFVPFIVTMCARVCVFVHACVCVCVCSLARLCVCVSMASVCA